MQNVGYIYISDVDGYIGYMCRNDLGMNEVIIYRGFRVMAILSVIHGIFCNENIFLLPWICGIMNPIFEYALKIYESFVQIVVI